MTAPSRAEMPDERETYVVRYGDIEDDVVGVVSNPLTGRKKAVLISGDAVVLNEPLCSGCDAPIADGPCGCMRKG